MEKYFLSPNMQTSLTTPPSKYKGYLYVTDLTGKQYSAQLTTTIDTELNGNQSLSATILPTKVNKAFISDITEMWTITDHDNVEQRIIHVVRRGKGDGLTVDIKAIPLFFDVMDTLRIYDRYDEHMTAQLAFSRIFEDTGFSFTLNGSFDAVQWEGFGDGETRLETFKRALERYKCEFRIVGNIVYIEHQIENDTNHQYRHKLNASNIVQEVDANELWTYAKGYGDYGDGGGGEDWQNAKLKREYTSPLSKIIGIRHAPPIKNGNITTKAQMDSQLKTLVDESLKISITADIHDLTRQNYPIAQSQLGDRVFVIDERIGLDEEVRIVNKSITRNWRGDILDVTLTFGSEGLAKRHQSNLNTALKNVTDWITGRKTIPYSIVDEAIKNATQALKNAQTELKFENGILAIDKQDPNKVVLLNSAGIGVSSDGGNTFKNSITGDGVIAETVIGKNLIGLNITSPNEDGYFHVNGSDAEFVNVSNGRKVEIRPEGLYGRNANNSIRFQADAELVTSSAFGTSNGNVYLASEAEGESRVVDYASLGGSGSFLDYTYRPIRAQIFRFDDRPYGYFTLYSGGEFRFTGENTTNPVFLPIRVGKVFSNDVESRGDILYLRATNRVRTYAKGSSSALIDLETGTVYNSAMITNTTNAYIGTDDELRVVNKGLGNTYRDVRASTFRGIALSLSETSNATHLHIRPANNGEVQVTSRSNSSSFRPIRAREFITDTSLRENKRNVDIYDVDVLKIIRKANTYLYNRANEGTYTKKQLGLMLDELPYETYSERGDGFGIYGLVTFLFRGLKQAVEEIDKLKGED